MATAPAELTDFAACCLPAAVPAALPDTASAATAPAPLALIVREGLTSTPKQLPPWLFYDDAGSLLFEQITRLPEYYPTRIERAILESQAGEMISAAADGKRIRVIELGAGSADKTRTLLSAALAHQGRVDYLPVDVSASALDMACDRIEAELPGVHTQHVVADYTQGWEIPGDLRRQRQLLLWIGSSIGNFEPQAACELLRRINETMRPGDCLLLGVDLAPALGGKCVGELIAAYDDEAGITAQFNTNLLTRLNRELGAAFDLDSFQHCVDWNAKESRIEMHLESTRDQWIPIDDLGMRVHFAPGERLHTENSYKYTLEKAAELMAAAGFPVAQQWTDEGEWFAVLLGCKA